MPFMTPDDEQAPSFSSRATIKDDCISKVDHAALEMKYLQGRGDGFVTAR
jgi:hypothetical protein